MKTLYLQCNMGAAGDMLMAALYELLEPQAREEFLRDMNALGIPGLEVAAVPAQKCGIWGTHMDVRIRGQEEQSLDVPHGHAYEHGHDHGVHGHFHPHGDDHIEGGHCHGHEHPHEGDCCGHGHHHEGEEGHEHGHGEGCCGHHHGEEGHEHSHCHGAHEHSHAEGHCHHHEGGEEHGHTHEGCGCHERDGEHPHGTDCNHAHAEEHTHGHHAHPGECHSHGEGGYCHAHPHMRSEDCGHAHTERSHAMQAESQNSELTFPAEQMQEHPHYHTHAHGEGCERGGELGHSHCHAHEGEEDHEHGVGAHCHGEAGDSAHESEHTHEHGAGHCHHHGEEGHEHGHCHSAHEHPHGEGRCHHHENDGETHTHNHEDCGCHGHDGGHAHGHHEHPGECHSHDEGHGHCHGHSHAHGHSHSHSGMADIEHLLSHLPLSERVRAHALAVYRLIAQAESHAHGQPISQIHFHEVGSMDAVADVVGVCMLMERIGAQRILASAVHVGSGQVRCAHGVLPVPAPATAHILQGVPTYGGEIAGELCTPTGAALLRHFAQGFGPMPALCASAIGYGMGTKDFAAANCVRAFLGDDGAGEGGPNGEIALLCCNLDDMPGEDLGFAQQALLSEGALDVYTLPIGMKKSRPAVLLCCICEPSAADRLAAAILRHTSTFGVRKTLCQRYMLSRSFEQVSTPHGDVRIKTGQGYGVSKSKPEYEDIARIAREQGISLAEARALLA